MQLIFVSLGLFFELFLGKMGTKEHIVIVQRHKEKESNNLREKCAGKKDYYYLGD